MRMLILAFCVASVLANPLNAQERTAIPGIQTVGFILQKEQPEGTLPPVEVRPPNSTPYTFPGDGILQSNGNQAGQASPNNQSPYSFPGPGISWSSGQLYSDQQLVGPYNQPVWTTQRPWATTRVYVLPPGQAQVEQWVRTTYPRGAKPKFRFLEEFAIGLPGRF